jgi:hypothetical protein
MRRRGAPVRDGAAAAAFGALAAVAALGLGGCACDRRAPLASCEDDLRGVYAADGRRWMILDNAGELEAYPLFSDVPPAPGLEVAPRVIALQRTPRGLTGHVRRRYMRGSQACVAEAPARVTACAGDAIELVLSDPEPPIAWPAAPEQPCGWPRPGSSRRERWIRE